MKTIWSLLCVVLLSASTLAVVKINDILTYKPCFHTGGCDGEEVCFQYFCYPKSGMDTPLRSCKKTRKDCGDLGDYTCFKKITSGICIPSDDDKICEGHEDCEGRGGKCCGDYCCNEEYFKELQKTECSEDDEVCLVYRKDVLANMVTYEKESLACESNEECEGKHKGHKCCSDNPLLKDVLLSEELQNWKGDKRCCFSATGERQLDKIENLSQEDKDNINQKLTESSSKRTICKGFDDQSFHENFNTCIEEKKKEKAEAEADLLATIKKHKEAAATAKSKAKTAADNAKNAETSEVAQQFADEANTAATNASNAAAAAANLTAQDPTLTGSTATEAAELVNAAKKDAEEAKTFADNAQKAANSKVDTKTNIKVIENDADNNKTSPEVDPSNEHHGQETTNITITKISNEEDTSIGSDQKQQNSGYAISSSFVGIVSILMLNFFIN